MAALMCLTSAFAEDAPSLASIAALLRSGQAAQAEAMATGLLAAKDQSPLNKAYLLLDRGLAREQMRKRADAVKDFSSAIGSNTLPRGDLARALFDRGVVLDEMGRTDSAVADYSRAIGLVPRYAAALNNRGNAYRRMDRYAEARADYRAALAAGDDEPEYPLYGLGRLAEAQGDPVLAKAFYQRALAANANFTSASNRMAALGSVGNSYKLRVPGEMEPVPVTTRRESEPKQSQPASVAERAEGAQDDFTLRPAILDVGRKKPSGGALAHVASFIPPEPSEGSTGSSGALVQLGAWRNQGDAALGWDKLAARAGALLSRARPRIVEAEVPGKGHFWRLRTRAPEGVSAADFCARFHAKGLACIAAKS